MLQTNKLVYRPGASPPAPDIISLRRGDRRPL